MNSFVVIGNPENRRVALFQEALRRLACDPAIVVPWMDVIEGRENWARHVRPGTIVRIDSPGENWPVERALIAAGAEIADSDCPDSPRISRCAALELDDDRGRIRFLRQWYRGFCAVLESVERQLDERPLHTRMHSAASIALMFDKVRCQDLLKRSGFPTPRPLGRVRSYDKLLAAMDRSGINRVFVKPAHGSSASGVIAYERSGARQQAFTSIELVRERGKMRLFNSLKVRRYTKARDIADMIDAIAREYALAEAWYPKAVLRGRSMDLRILTIDGRARHAVARTSRSPMTNLHLGNQRGDLSEVQALMPDEWPQLAADCERALTLFPGALYAGIDVLIGTGFRGHAIAEVNAFGDLLPNLLHENQTPCEAIAAASLRHNAPARVAMAAS